MPILHMADGVLAALGERAGAAFASFADAAAPAAVAALWQDSLVALALFLALRFVVRISAAHRFAAWTAGFVVAAILPLLPFFQHSSAAVSALPTGGEVARPLLELDSRWGFAIAGLWLAASGFRAIELFLDLRRLRELWHSAAAIAAEPNLRMLLAAALPKRRIEICTTPDLERPSVIGFFDPRILIPDWLYSRLTPGELEQVVLHEAEHLRRRDDWTNLLQKLSLVLFPLNPVLAWMERRLCREREMACDEGVVERTKAPRTYAACLTALAERRLEHREFERRDLLRRAQALSLGAFERRPELVSRVDRILRCRKTLHPLAAGALVGIVGCGLVIGAVGLSRSPQLVAFVAAQKPDAQIAAFARPDAPRIVRNSDHRINEPSPAADDAVFHSAGHYRAIETKSDVPAARNAAGPPVAAQSPRSGETPETAMPDGKATPHQVMVNRAASAPAAISSQGQEFLVLTAWEEVETSAPASSGRTARRVADYDTGAGEQTQSDDSTSERNTSPAAQISVTRLILLVYPESAALGSTAGATADTKLAHTTSSRSHRPTASVFDGGWLFFQL
jgi:beta-lactamase regulating signal transducer with metallopeptidase domain